MILPLLWGIVFVTSVMTGMAAVMRAFYCIAKRMGAEGVERRLWNKRYYKAMGTFILMWLLGAISLWIRHVAGWTTI
jgi:hypothetical protein